MVLDEINSHFKMSVKESKQLKLFNAIVEVLNMDENFNIKNDKNKDIEITWVEGGGIGYCLTEEDYNTRQKAVEKHTEEEIKK